MGAPSVHPIAVQKSGHATNPQAGPGTFESIISKSTQRLRACGGQISRGSTRRRKTLAWGHGPVAPQARLIVDRTKIASENGPTQEGNGLVPGSSVGLRTISRNRPFSAPGALEHRG
jgi:hypothetical protein